METNFSNVYQQAVRMAESVNIAPFMPKSCVHQRNRPNAKAETTEDWYSLNAVIPFFDHILAELDSQFSAIAQQSSKLLRLVPSILCSQHGFQICEAL